MLVAIIDCLVQAELSTLIATLKQDGIRCIESATDIVDINRALERFSNDLVVIYGSKSMDLPFDDCHRIWLVCGCDAQNDQTEAAFLYGPVPPPTLARQQTALVHRSFRRMTYVQALCFFANQVAERHVHQMQLGSKEANIMLRHVRDTSYIG